MTEKRGVDPLDFTNLGEVDNSAKNEETEQATKKKGSLWPWLLGAGAAFGGWWLYNKKKAQATEALQRAEEEPQGEESKKPVLGGGPVIYPEERNLSEPGADADDRLRAMGEDPEKGSTPQARENWKEL